MNHYTNRELKALRRELAPYSRTVMADEIDEDPPAGGNHPDDLIAAEIEGRVYLFVNGVHTPYGDFRLALVAEAK